MPRHPISIFFFFFNDTATTEIYTLSLHDALPILPASTPARAEGTHPCRHRRGTRSEEHTSELQSRLHLVCRLLLEKKKSNVEGGQPRCSQLIDPRRALSRMMPLTYVTMH